MPVMFSDTFIHAFRALFRALSMTQKWSGVTTNSTTSTLIRVDRPASTAAPLQLRFSTKTAPFTPWKSSVACGKYKTR